MTKYFLSYPVISPDLRNMSIIKYESGEDKIFLSYLNRDEKELINIDEINDFLPTICWGENSETLYYAKKEGKIEYLYSWNIKSKKTVRFMTMENIDIIYLFPRTNKSRILFLAKEISGKPILGAIDICAMEYTYKTIGGVHSEFFDSFYFTDDNHFILMGEGSENKKVVSRLYLSDITLNIEKIAEYSGDTLIPLAYDRASGRIIFLKNLNEIVSMDLREPERFELIYKHKK
jgi:hypothetical protein